MKELETLIQVIPSVILEIFSKHWLNEPVFIMTSGNILYPFLARTLL